ncbi:MAG: hypothetical protein FFODKBPE_00341 [Candidatus Argoarchaeum ethanivorans]|uniref:Uncharacterized protein n=1 Tax=Candidatus Argoarchaeum ethanivorans TaxID=2608793 RepID=A0A811TAC1_9EURY|nr:MAG: hypothetical protein FFODKBPE_00341 [Candidatus Argoarchaeum ethanivorans]
MRASVFIKYDTIKTYVEKQGSKKDNLLLKAPAISLI